ncbi:hypothetical protein E8E13_011585 [Curvularia kusanoi]|uniref:FAD dependent oxidoreductase domain-containing protein n=1 Tax=Curvularia kusanoi TaxID=90978 RepID=A0A9P4WCQ8_CURKU|nr:hypothetical protein E8E13_011585 [Curvularia kusanoi]
MSPDRYANKFPVANGLSSYWRNQIGPIDTHRTTINLEESSDIVIIGAGYAGASIAHHLLEEAASSNGTVPSIIILEAREACSGATGRNGGHLKPDPVYRASRMIDSHGRAVAEHVASFEARHIDAIEDLVSREHIDCDFERAKAIDVCLYDAGQVQMKAIVDKLIQADLPSAKEVQLHLGPEAEEVSGVKGALSCLSYNAARLWPYKLVAHLLEKAISRGVHLQTFTPVTSVSPTKQDLEGYRWLVHTTRGSIRSRSVIYATNGYTSALVQEMKDKIVPVRGIVARLAGAKLPELKNSYLMRFSDQEYDYMISRPDGSIILGGARRDFYKKLNQWYDVTDDSRLMEGARGYFDGYMQRHFAGWEDSDVQSEEVWTGIMGYSNDGFPFVGPVCDKPGQFICAGFTGHGMPQVYLSAKAVASMVLTGETAEVDLPIPYRLSKERWYQARDHMSLEAWRKVVGNETTHAVL